MCCLVVQVFVYACGGFKKKKWKKIFRDQQWLPKKWLRFLFKRFFSDKPFLVYKKIIYFSKSIFADVTGNVLEEYVDLIVTQDHSASRETIEGSKKVITVITSLYQNF